MSIAAVSSVEGEGFLTFSFTFEGKDRKMQRSKKALTRAELSSKKKAKKVKRSADLKISIGKTPKTMKSSSETETLSIETIYKNILFFLFFLKLF